MWMTHIPAPSYSRHDVLGIDKRFEKSQSIQLEHFACDQLIHTAYINAKVDRGLKPKSAYT